MQYGDSASASACSDCVGGRGSMAVGGKDARAAGGGRWSQPSPRRALNEYIATGGSSEFQTTRPLPGASRAPTRALVERAREGSLLRAAAVAPAAGGGQAGGEAGGEAGGSHAGGAHAGGAHAGSSRAGGLAAADVHQHVDYTRPASAFPAAPAAPAAPEAPVAPLLGRHELLLQPAFSRADLSSGMADLLSEADCEAQRGASAGGAGLAGRLVGGWVVTDTAACWADDRGADADREKDKGVSPRGAGGGADWRQAGVSALEAGGGAGSTPSNAGWAGAAPAWQQPQDGLVAGGDGREGGGDGREGDRDGREGDGARLASDDRLTVVVVTSEVAPFSKSGGLGDVAEKLGEALASLGHQVVLPAARARAHTHTHIVHPLL